MALANTTWRKHSFKVGNTYVALVTIKGIPLDFTPGLTYVLDAISYSHYDSSTVLTFSESGSGVSIQWWWHDDEADADVGALFASRN